VVEVRDAHDRYANISKIVRSGKGGVPQGRRVGPAVTRWDRSAEPCIQICCTRFYPMPTHESPGTPLKRVHAQTAIEEGIRISPPVHGAPAFGNIGPQPPKQPAVQPRPQSAQIPNPEVTPSPNSAPRRCSWKKGSGHRTTSPLRRAGETATLGHNPARAYRQ
jgi:hypothetical protein